MDDPLGPKTRYGESFRPPADSIPDAKPPSPPRSPETPQPSGYRSDDGVDKNPVASRRKQTSTTNPRPLPPLDRNVSPNKGRSGYGRSRPELRSDSPRLRRDVSDPLPRTLSDTFYEPTAPSLNDVFNYLLDDKKTAPALLHDVFESIYPRGNDAAGVAQPKEGSLEARVQRYMDTNHPGESNDPRMRGVRLSVLPDAIITSLYDMQKEIDIRSVKTDRLTASQLIGPAACALLDEATKPERTNTWSPIGVRKYNGISQEVAVDLASPGVGSAVDMTDRMPALRATSELFEGRPPPLKDAFVFGSQHMFYTNEVFWRQAEKLGLMPENTTIYGKTGASETVGMRLMQRGYTVSGASFAEDLRGAGGSTGLTLPTEMSNPAINDVRAFFDRIFGETGRYPCPADPGERKKFMADLQRRPPDQRPNIVLLDEGFKVGQALLDLQVDEKYKDFMPFCHMVEHTQGGIVKGREQLGKYERNNPVLPPVVNVAESYAKKMLEGPVIAADVNYCRNFVQRDIFDSVVLGNSSDVSIQNLKDKRPKECAVIGFGAVAGEGAPQVLEGYDVHVWDTDPIALRRAIAAAKPSSDGSPGSPISVPIPEGELENLILALETEFKLKPEDWTAPEPTPAVTAAKKKAREQLTAWFDSGDHKKEFFSHGYEVFGNTGATSGCLSKADLQHLPDGAMLWSGASGNYEFGGKKGIDSYLDTSSGGDVEVTESKYDSSTGRCLVPFNLTCSPNGDRQMVDLPRQDKEAVRHRVFDVTAAQEKGNAVSKRIMFPRNGVVINRLYGVPPEFIDLTRAIVLTGVAQAALALRGEAMPGSNASPEGPSKASSSGANPQPPGLNLVALDQHAQEQLAAVANENLESHELGSMERPEFDKLATQFIRRRYGDAGGNPNYDVLRQPVAVVTDADGARRNHGLTLLQYCMLSRDELPGAAIDYVKAHSLTKDGKSLLTDDHGRTPVHTLCTLLGDNQAALDSALDQFQQTLGLSSDQINTLRHEADKFGVSPNRYAELRSSARASENEKRALDQFHQELQRYSRRGGRKPSQNQLTGAREAFADTMAAWRQSGGPSEGLRIPILASLMPKPSRG